MEYTDIPGFFDFAAVYDEAVTTARHGDVLVELGAYYGRSTVYMARCIRDSGKSLYFYTVDLWGRSPETEHLTYLRNDIYEQFMVNVTECGVGNWVHALRGSTTSHAANIPDNLHFCFLDAGHKYEQVLSDIALYLPKIRSGGMLAGHDVNYEAVHRAVQEMLPNVEIHGNSWIYRKP